MQKTPLKPADLLSHARSMRREAAPAEMLLWRRLRNRRLQGYRFRRQAPLPPFIADFYCPHLRLVIEIDGDSHSENHSYDASRTLRLERDGLHVVRFNNDDVYKNSDAVLEAILAVCERLDDRKAPSP